MSNPNEVTVVMQMLQVWPLLAFAMAQAGAFLLWVGSVKAELKNLKESSSTSAKNGERLANMEGKLDGIISAIDNIQQSMPKRRGT